MPEPVRTKPYSLDVDAVARIHLQNARPRLIVWAAPFVAFVYVVMVVYFGIPWHLALVVAAVATVGGFMGQPKRMKKLLSAPAYRLGFVERQAEISSDTYRQTDVEGTDSTIPLDRFLSAKLLRDHYVLALVPTQNVLIPRTAFASTEDERRFQEYIRAKVPKVTGF